MLRSPRPRRCAVSAPVLAARLVGAPLALLLAAAPARADGPDLVLSLTSAGTLPGATVDDEELFLAPSGGGARLLVPERTLAMFFDAAAAGAHAAPGDIDALDLVATAPGSPWIGGVYFSTVSDEGGFLDGDVLRFDPATGTVTVAFSEALLVAATGVADGNLDVDAVSVADDGELLFSLNEDETIGGATVPDECVFRLPPGAASAVVLFDAAALEAAVATALGGPVTIGDVKGIDRHGDALLFTVQSPSDHDATVFTTANGGAVFDGRSEASLGFLDAVEADALAVLPGAAFPTLDLAVGVLAEGQPVSATLRGLAPSGPFLMLLSGTADLGGSHPTPGFGQLHLGLNDPFFLAAAANAPALLGVADGQGDGGVTGIAPAFGGGPYDLVLQVVDAAGRASNPVVLEVNQ